MNLLNCTGYTLKEGKVSAQGSAGLGLIDIARESTQPMKWDFVAIDDVKSFFMFSAATKERDDVPVEGINQPLSFP